MNHEREMVAMAEGYLELGEFQEAWDFTETIPCIQRICPGIVRVRIICAIALRQFEIAEELACFLGTGPSPFRKFAGGILHELAGAYCHAGDTEHARKLISDAIRIWPDERFSIIENPALESLF